MINIDLLSDEVLLDCFQKQYYDGEDLDLHLVLSVDNIKIATALLLHYFALEDRTNGTNHLDKLRAGLSKNKLTLKNCQSKFGYTMASFYRNSDYYIRVFRFYLDGLINDTGNRYPI